MASTIIDPLESQVGGHAGVLTIQNGALRIKPAVPTELAFYQRLQQDSNLEDLRPFTPTFLGTLKLMGKVDEAGSAASESIVLESVASESEEKDEYLVFFISQSGQFLILTFFFFFFFFGNPQSIVLENLSYSFLKPNILDIKLGTVLYDENASPEKVARMQKHARETTSLETGVRLTGFQVSSLAFVLVSNSFPLHPLNFQVYDNITRQHVLTPKSYGRSLKAAQLGEGIAKFFPVGSPTPNMPGTSSSGLPKETLEPILRAIYSEIAEIRQVYSTLEIRMVGASLLIIYEADWTRAEQSLTTSSEEEDEKDKDDEIDVDDDGDDDDDDEDESNSKRPGPPFVTKLIDFAHTRLAPGEGPDQSVLIGLDTVLKLLDARLEEIGTS